MKVNSNQVQVSPLKLPCTYHYIILFRFIIWKLFELKQLLYTYFHEGKCMKIQYVQLRLVMYPVCSVMELEYPCKDSFKEL